MSRTIIDMAKNLYKMSSAVEQAWLREQAKHGVFKSQLMQQPYDPPSEDYRQKRQKQALELLQAGVVSRQTPMDHFGIDYNKERVDMQAEQARLNVVRRKAREASARLAPFVHDWIFGKERNWFLRGDVVRVLRITPREVGRLLRDMRADNLLRNEGQWWQLTAVAVGVEANRKPLPQPPPRNVFGNQNKAYYDGPLGLPQGQS